MDMTTLDIAEFEARAENAANLLKAMSNSRRLLVLCQLNGGELSVGALQDRVGLSQSAMSQHLSRLKDEGLVESRRDAQTIYYRLSDPTAVRIIEVLAARFCPDL